MSDMPANVASELVGHVGHACNVVGERVGHGPSSLRDLLAEARSGVDSRA